MKCRNRSSRLQDRWLRITADALIDVLTMVLERWPLLITKSSNARRDPLPADRMQLSATRPPPVAQANCAKQFWSGGCT